MQVLDFHVLPTPIMREQYLGQRQQQQDPGQPEPRWNCRPAAWGSHAPPSAAEVATDKSAAALAAQRPAYKGLGSWGQQLHVVPLGEHCGRGKGAGVRAEGWSPKSRSSHGRRGQAARGV